MFVPKNHEVTMRCPVCFSRDVDVLMKHHNNGQYSCLKCSFNGSEEVIRDLYLDIQKKFLSIEKRITIEDYEKL